jgi:hypothetical protein
MRVWIPSLLFTAPTPYKREYTAEADPSLVVDLRKQSGNYAYGETKTGFSVVTLEIPVGNVLHDTGRAVKDKDATVKKLCKRIVDVLRQKRSVVIICYDGMTTSGFIAIVCRWWHAYAMKAVPADLDFIREVRDANDFTSAKGKEQRAQMESVRQEAIRIVRWEGFVEVKLT